MLCPSAFASAYPLPSLPVFGNDSPPVASTTADAARGPCGVVSTKPPP